MAESLRARGIDVVVVASEAAVGGGGAPGVVIASVALSLPRVFAERLRHSIPPVVGRVAGDRCLVDLRTVPPSDDESLKANIMICATTQ
jgi:L-seryl-tRNA(Ser) seleniumtransferase